MAYDRATFQRSAQDRLDESKILAAQAKHSGAYYLAGYAIECALKARIAAQFLANEIPNKALVNRIYTHDLTELFRLAGLEQELKVATEADQVLRRRWSIVVKWSEESRYQICSEATASDMIDAVSGGGEENGIFQWLINRW